MRIVVAPDSFKGSLTAAQAAAAMARGVRAALPAADVIEAPVADGGEGTLDVLVRATGGERRSAHVTGPLGEPIEAAWGVLGDGRTAVVEAAAAAGYAVVPAARRDPRRATTRGVGELIRAALDAGLRRVIVGAGGSATNDGGAGAARALGVRLLDAAGADLHEDGGAALARVARIDLHGLDPRIGDSEIIVACDVINPLTGPSGASRVYGPQKGASAEDVAVLDAALARYARAARAATGLDLADAPHGGAAGGLAAGLAWFARARLAPGIDVVLDVLRFDDLVRGAALVLTGEGRTDRQTAFGKAPAGVARAARRQRVRVVCVAGELGEGADGLGGPLFDALVVAAPPRMETEAAMAHAAPLVERAAARVVAEMLASPAGGRPRR